MAKALKTHRTNGQTKKVSASKVEVAKSTVPRRRLPTTTKGKMRRERLKSAAASLLKETSYHDLTLEQLTQEAGIPTSVFYHYFSSKKDLVVELLDEVFEAFEASVSRAGPFGAFEVGIRFASAEILMLYRDNIGLMRCLSEVEESEFAARWRMHLHEWRNRIALALTEFCDSKFQDSAELAALSHSLSVMTESIAYEAYVLNNEAFTKRFTSIDVAADFVSTLWVRAMFKDDPKGINAGQFSTLAHLHDLEAGR